MDLAAKITRLILSASFEIIPNNFKFNFESKTAPIRAVFDSMCSDLSASVGRKSCRIKIDFGDLSGTLNLFRSARERIYLNGFVPPIYRGTTKPLSRPNFASVCLAERGH